MSKTTRKGLQEGTPSRRQRGRPPQEPPRPKRSDHAKARRLRRPPRNHVRRCAKAGVQYHGLLGIWSPRLLVFGSCCRFVRSFRRLFWHLVSMLTGYWVWLSVFVLLSLASWASGAHAWRFWALAAGFGSTATLSLQFWNAISAG